MARLTRTGLALLACLSLATSAVAESEVLKSTTHGSPKLQSIDVLSFAPEGVLLIGDGRGAQIFAVQTEQKATSEQMPAKIEGINEKIAGRLGAKTEDIAILDLTVHPVSRMAYIAVRNGNKGVAIVTVDTTGKIGELSLESVKYARLTLPAGENAPITKVTDVAWAGDRVIAAGRSSEEFASKIFVIKAPLVNDAKGDVFSAETYHVSHRKWETKAPMSSILPFNENGEVSVVGAFSCTPVVKYPVSSIQPGAKVKGTSVMELGSGNQPIDMLIYEKNGKAFVLANTFRFHHAKRPFGPSPYWTVQFDLDLLRESENVNEKAVNRLDAKNPAASKIKMIEAYHGVSQMDKLDTERAVVLRTNEGGRIDFEVVPLP